METWPWEEVGILLGSRAFHRFRGRSLTGRVLEGIHSLQKTRECAFDFAQGSGLCWTTHTCCCDVEVAIDKV